MEPCPKCKKIDLPLIEEATFDNPKGKVVITKYACPHCHFTVETKQLDLTITPSMMR